MNSGKDSMRRSISKHGFIAASKIRFMICSTIPNVLLYIRSWLVFIKTYSSNNILTGSPSYNLSQAPDLLFANKSGACFYLNRNCHQFFSGGKNKFLFFNCLFDRIQFIIFYLSRPKYCKCKHYKCSCGHAHICCVKTCK